MTVFLVFVKCVQPKSGFTQKFKNLNENKDGFQPKSFKEQISDKSNKKMGKQTQN